MILLATDGKTEFTIDEFNYEKVSKHRWGVSRNKWGNYIHARINGKWQYLHRFLMSAKTGDVVDHVNGNRLDNRMSNLRFSTESQNSHNRRVGKNSESGIIGVTFHKRDNLWISEIMVDGKRIHLGYYKKNEFYLAVVARLMAEKKYLGEFSPQRRLFKEYGVE